MQGALTAEEWNEAELARVSLREQEDEKELEALLVSDFIAADGSPLVLSETATRGCEASKELEAGRACGSSAAEFARMALLKARDHVRASADGFPVSCIEELQPSSQPEEDIERLVRQLAKDGDYQAVRDSYCQLSTQLNLVGRWAPAFRTDVRLGKPPGHQDHTTLLRDKIVIDCHWLQATGAPVRCSDLRLKCLFDKDEPFDFEEAWAFAKHQWTAMHRANYVLSLTNQQQIQLAVLHGEVVSTRRAAALGGKGARSLTPVRGKIGEVMRCLNEWAERDCRVVPHLEDYRRLWLVRELLGPEAPLRSIAALFALATGQTQKDEKTIRDKLKKLDASVSRGLAGC